MARDIRYRCLYCRSEQVITDPAPGPQGPGPQPCDCGAGPLFQFPVKVTEDEGVTWLAKPWLPTGFPGP
jgi:hypothetical protein